jgi:hypothetical protein
VNDVRDVDGLQAAPAGVAACGSRACTTAAAPRDLRRGSRTAERLPRSCAGPDLRTRRLLRPLPQGRRAP